ncbi:MAG TPA: hypothetical protein VKV95_00115 [Terriglobia bacterium]|nr:hypothetical protein [Terriglobia bacterium]
MRQTRAFQSLGSLVFIGTLFLMGGPVGLAQESPSTSGSAPSSSNQGAVPELEREVRELRAAMARMQGQMDHLQAETANLKSELRDTRSRLAVAEPGDLASLSPTPGNSNALPARPAESKAGDSNGQGQEEARLANLEEDQELLKAKINDQYQTKVESASKYRVRLSGIALFNAYTNRGGVENQDVPTWASSSSFFNSNGTFGATVRQSEIGLEVFGPELAGAKTSGEIHMDFFGGFPTSSNGVTEGAMRMRTATVRMDWKDTSIIMGQDSLFFSPLSPTSYASLAVPALSYAGNLWSWAPQIRVEHEIHVSDTSEVTLQAGILDPLTGELPKFQFNRAPQAGESSGLPALATRVAWTQSVLGRPFTIGAGGYYSRQNWGFDRIIDGWAGTADLDLPLGKWFTFTGEFYRGRAIGGLGGGLGRSVLYNGALNSPNTEVLGLNTVGGWGQMAFRPTQRLEFNGALGEDNPLAEDFTYFNAAQSYIVPGLIRNRGAFTNVIYQPRSDLVLSLEYRRLWSYYVSGSNQTANQVNLGIGILF